MPMEAKIEWLSRHSLTVKPYITHVVHAEETQMEICSEECLGSAP